MYAEPASFKHPRNTRGKSIIEVLLRDPVKFAEFMGADVQPYQRQALRALAPKPRKFKHNRRG